jgi:cytochrome c-type biogenesis protein CcsB
MSYWETIFFWIALILYSLASGGYIYGFTFKNPRFISRMTYLVAAGFVAHNVVIGARYYAQGHLPWSGDYENGLMTGWFIISATLYIGWHNKALRALATVTAPLVVILMGYGYMRNPMLTPMAASLKSYWLYIHVYFAQLAFGAYTLATAAGVLYLLKKRNSAKGTINPAYDRFPSLDRLDDLIFRYVLFGFMTDTIMIAAGSIWAKDLWGSYWSWDPVETWSLISWLAYGICIHLRVTFGWRETRLAWLVIAALSTVIISFFGVNFLVDTSMHFFNVR